MALHTSVSFSIGRHKRCGIIWIRAQDKEERVVGGLILSGRAMVPISSITRMDVILCGNSWCHPGLQRGIFIRRYKVPFGPYPKVGREGRKWGGEKWGGWVGKGQNVAGQHHPEKSVEPRSSRLATAVPRSTHQVDLAFCSKSALLFHHGARSIHLAAEWSSHAHSHGSSAHAWGSLPSAMAEETP